HPSNCLGVSCWLLGSSMSLALRATALRCSNLFLTDLSFTPATYLCTLLGSHSLAVLMQCE
ncbi:TPA: hypothetical protein ACSUND_005096, partial [Salmonella enterica subsp. diarizonae]